jgi:hypothetical protein
MADSTTEHCKNQDHQQNRHQHFVVFLCGRASRSVSTKLRCKLVTKHSAERYRPLPRPGRLLVSQSASPSGGARQCAASNRLRNERAGVRSNWARDPFVAAGQPFESRVLRYLEPLERWPRDSGATESGSKTCGASGALRWNARANRRRAETWRRAHGEPHRLVIGRWSICGRRPAWRIAQRFRTKFEASGHPFDSAQRGKRSCGALWGPVLESQPGPLWPKALGRRHQ